MSNSYDISKQKLLNELDILDQNIHFLKCRTLNSPCITITGFDNLKIYPMMKQTSVKPSIHDVIYQLFLNLNIPYSWIFAIENPNKHVINIYLVTDNIKMYVYNTLLKYVKNTDQNLVFIKLLIT